MSLGTVLVSTWIGITTEDVALRGCCSFDWFDGIGVTVSDVLEGDDDNEIDA